MTLVKTLALAFTAAFSVLFVAPGCGAVTVEDLCTKWCCGGSCPASQQQNCVNQRSDEQMFAEDHGCGAEYQDYLDCMYDHACKPVAADECDGAFKAVDDCGGIPKEF